jgi:protein-S-isoprenylcysteine O-methyltransferase
VTGELTGRLRACGDAESRDNQDLILPPSTLPVIIYTRLSPAVILGMIYVTSELFLALTRQSGAKAVSHDRRSLFVLWTVITVCIWSALALESQPWGKLPQPRLCLILGMILFVAGIILRWSAIIHLGRFFTVNVAIAQKHELIDSGPYRLIRHPSYTGALLAFVGFGLSLGNGLGLVCLILPITAAFLWRIHVEERALTEALGDPYRNYMRRTKRLIPFVY